MINLKVEQLQNAGVLESANSINIQTINNIINKDGLIEGGNEVNLTDDGTSGDNLTLTTANLNTQDLKDTDHSDSSGFNLGVSTAQTTIGGHKQGHEKEGITRTTIGNGTINATNTEGEINRDLDKAQETTLDIETGGLNASVTIDNRVFTEGGRKSIKKDFLDTKNHTIEIGQAVKDVATTDKTILDFGSQVHKYATDRVLLTEKAANAEDQEKLRGEEGAEASEQAIQELSDELSAKDGLAENAEVNLYDGSQTSDDTAVNSKNDFNKGEALAGYHAEEKDIYINTDKTDMTDSASVVKSALHEQERYTQSQDGETKTFSKDSQTQLATARGDLAKGVWEDYSALSGFDTKSNTTQQQWNAQNLNTPTIQTGIEKIKPIDSKDIDPLTIFIHGTNSNPSQADPDFIQAVGETFKEEVVQFDWSGKDGEAGKEGDGAELSPEARERAAERLKELIENYKFAPNEKLNIVGHSHGGNVIREFTEIYSAKSIDNIYFLGTPNHEAHNLDYSKLNNKPVNVYDRSDGVQWIGSILGGKTFDSRKLDNDKAINIRVDPPNQFNINLLNVSLGTFFLDQVKQEVYDDHTNLDTKEVWNQVQTKLNKNEN